MGGHGGEVVVSEARSVVVTGASRGLGLASATYLHRRGWHVVAAMRSPDAGLARLREATGADEDDPRLTCVRLDLDDPGSIMAAGRAIENAVGAPDAVVHNAGVACAGCVEETPADVWLQTFTTNLFGPVRLTQALLPAMRTAGRGRIVVVSSVGGVRGIPTISAYSAAKGASERWAEALAGEVAPFGIGVTILVTGTFRTDILEKTRTYADTDGPYAVHHAALDQCGPRMMRLAKPPERFARALARALEESAPLARRAVGTDARMVLLASRLMPTRLYRAVTGRAMGVPRPGALRDHPVRLKPLTVPSGQSEQDA
ncbi:short-chain dehydrogenase/reductase [Pseudofrankia sp. EUN1h]|nr:short-chain dehydrogenase/reductase [Pseudofrankia sp. EUN1h]